jgi:hypothetical protein
MSQTLDSLDIGCASTLALKIYYSIQILQQFAGLSPLIIRSIQPPSLLKEPQ